MKTIRPHRFKDVLLALAASHNEGVFLQRLQLQKMIYLMDIFSAVWREVSKPASFEPEKRGPWDRQIQNAVDALAFRGLVTVELMKIRRVAEIRSTYGLSDAGFEVVDAMCQRPGIKDQMLLALEIAREVGRPHRGWKSIKDIVYAEPTYMAVRDSGSRHRVPVDDPLKNQTVILARMFADSWAWTSGDPPTREVFVQTLFLVYDVDPSAFTIST